MMLRRSEGDMIPKPAGRVLPGRVFGPWREILNLTPVNMLPGIMVLAHA
jgi:hypothetical protein